MYGVQPRGKAHPGFTVADSQLILVGSLLVRCVRCVQRDGHNDHRSTSDEQLINYAGPSHSSYIAPFEARSASSTGGGCLRWRNRIFEAGFAPSLEQQGQEGANMLRECEIP